MALFLIGLGLGEVKDITLKGLDLIKQCDVLYGENYTSFMQAALQDFEHLYEKKIILADRDLVENHAEQTILKDAKEKKVGFLVVGDPLVATTHADLVLRARKVGIAVEIVHNASVLTAIAETGLQLYKFGPIASIPFPAKDFFPETPYTIIKNNLERGLHTLVLLDLKPSENKAMSIKEAIDYLQTLEEKSEKKVLTDKKILACARLGSKNAVVKYGLPDALIKINFGKLPFCLIIPGTLHFVEEEFLNN